MKVMLQIRTSEPGEPVRTVNSRRVKPTPEGGIIRFPLGPPSSAKDYIVVLTDHRGHVPKKHRFLVSFAAHSHEWHSEQVQKAQVWFDPHVHWYTFPGTGDIIALTKIRYARVQLIKRSTELADLDEDHR